MRVLFICSQNKLRSPSAEQIFSDWPGVEAASAGTNNDAEVPVSAELLEWADVIFVMEKTHQNRLSKRFRAHLKHARLICLGIRDEYGFMEPELVAQLTRRVSPFLPPRT